jgi:hypothetical protein
VGDLPLQALSYTIVGGADSARFAINGSTGVLTFVSAPDFELPTDANGDNVYEVRVQVSDGSQTNAQMMSVTVINVNGSPAAIGDQYVIHQNFPLTSSIGVLANDRDLDGNPLTAVLVSGPSHGTLALNTDGSFHYTPDVHFHGTDSFTYLASNGSVSSDPVTVTITVQLTIPPPSVDPVDFDSPPAADPPPDVNPPPIETLPNTTPGEGPAHAEDVPSRPRSSPHASPPVVTAVADDSMPSADTSAKPIVGLTSKKTKSNHAVPAKELKQALARSSINDLTFQAAVGSLGNDLDQLGERMDADASIPDFTIGSAAGLTTTLSVGYVVCLIRGGHILAGLMAQLPAWRLIDPLPILGGLGSVDIHLA